MKNDKKIMRIFYCMLPLCIIFAVGIGVFLFLSSEKRNLKQLESYCSFTGIITDTLEYNGYYSITVLEDIVNSGSSHEAKLFGIGLVNVPVYNHDGKKINEKELQLDDKVKIYYHDGIMDTYPYTVNTKAVVKLH